MLIHPLPENKGEIIGPNIKPLPLNEPLPENLSIEVLLKAVITSPPIKSFPPEQRCYP